MKNNLLKLPNIKEEDSYAEMSQLLTHASNSSEMTFEKWLDIGFLDGLIMEQQVVLAEKFQETAVFLLYLEKMKVCDNMFKAKLKDIPNYQVDASVVMFPIVRRIFNHINNRDEMNPRDTEYEQNLTKYCQILKEKNHEVDISKVFSTIINIFSSAEYIEDKKNENGSRIDAEAEACCLATEKYIIETAKEMI